MTTTRALDLDPFPLLGGQGSRQVRAKSWPEVDTRRIHRISCRPNKIPPFGHGCRHRGRGSGDTAEGLKARLLWSRTSPSTFVLFAMVATTPGTFGDTLSSTDNTNTRLPGGRESSTPGASCFVPAIRPHGMDDASLIFGQVIPCRSSFDPTLWDIHVLSHPVVSPRISTAYRAQVQQFRRDTRTSQFSRDPNPARL